MSKPHGYLKIISWVFKNKVLWGSGKQIGSYWTSTIIVGQNSATMIRQGVEGQYAEGSTKWADSPSTIGPSSLKVQINVSASVDKTVVFTSYNPSVSVKIGIPGQTGGNIQGTYLLDPSGSSFCTAAIGKPAATTFSGNMPVGSPSEKKSIYVMSMVSIDQSIQENCIDCKRHADCSRKYCWQRCR